MNGPSRLAVLLPVAAIMFLPAQPADGRQNKSVMAQPGFPAAQRSGIAVSTLLVASAALLFGGTATYAVRRRAPRTARRPDRPSAPPPTVPPSLLPFLVALGRALIDGGKATSSVQRTLGRVAVLMTPVARLAARARNGPPPPVSVLPAFWLPVPGALGLLGVTEYLGTDPRDGLDTLVTTAATMVAVALGALLGSEIRWSGRTPADVDDLVQGRRSGGGGVPAAG